MRSLLALSAACLASARDLTAVARAGGDVRAVSRVGPLPGITAPSFAGSFVVNETAGASLFFWFWPALNGNSSAPVLTWSQGGPGSSSLFGMFVEHGPYRLDAALAPHAFADTWAREYNVVYVDGPRGTGYSVAGPGQLCTTWECYAGDLDSFSRQFVAAFGLEANDFYMTGESYGGHYVPAAAATIVANNAAGKVPRVNLRGVAIGNGFVAPLEMSAGYGDLIFNAGLLSPSEYIVAQSYTRNITRAIEAEDYVGAYLIWDSYLNGDSTPGGAWFTNVTGLTNYFNVAVE